jgi:hypothetical protein
LGQMKALQQCYVITDAFVHVGVLGVFGSQHQMVFWESGLFGKGVELLRSFDHPVQALGGTVCKARHFNP